MSEVKDQSNSYSWNDLYSGRWNFDNPSWTGYQDDMLTGGLNWRETYGMRMEAYFIAPATGVYHFRLSCDDNCMFYMGETEQSKQAIVDFRMDGEDSSYLQHDK